MFDAGEINGWLLSFGFNQVSTAKSELKVILVNRIHLC